MNEYPDKIGRRDALKRIATAATAVAVVPHVAGAAAADQPADGPARLNPAAAVPRGTPTDPDLLNPVVPWKKILTKDELRTTSALCDVIIPADDRSPSATAVGVPDFIDEWVSAPYPPFEEDRQIVRGGLAWINTESHKRFQKEFADLTNEQKHAICDDICHEPKAKPEHKVGARFFDKMRNLTLSGFYTTAEGWKDLPYVGNVSLANFDGPPPEVLKHLGLV